MPITDTLTSARKLEESGVPPQQARVLSELFEQTAAAAQQDLKAFIAAEGERTRTELRTWVPAIPYRDWNQTCILSNPQN